MYKRQVHNDAPKVANLNGPRKARAKEPGFNSQPAQMCIRDRVNLRSVGSYGRFEFWFAMIKFATIVAFILAGSALLFSGRVAPQYRCV